MLADVAASFGLDLARNEKLSVVSCLTCGRTLARILGNFKKITLHYKRTKALSKRPGNECQGNHRPEI